MCDMFEENQKLQNIKLRKVIFHHFLKLIIKIGKNKVSANSKSEHHKPSCTQVHVHIVSTRTVASSRRNKVVCSICFFILLAS